MTNKARPLSYYLKYLNTNNQQTEWTLFAILWVKKYFSKADTQIFLASIISKIASFKVSIIQVQVRAWTKSSYRLLEHCRKAARSSKWWFWRGVQFKKLTFSFLNWTPLQNHHLLERATLRQCSSNL